MQFYFYKKPERKIRTEELLNSHLPNILENIPWKKSMKWGDYSMFWGRPLKSILAIFNGKPLNFKYHHLICSNVTYLDKDFEEKLIRFKDFKSYMSYFKNRGIIINNNLRRNFIEKELIKSSSKKNLKVYINEKLLSEVTDIVEKPKTDTNESSSDIIDKKVKSEVTKVEFNDILPETTKTKLIHIKLKRGDFLKKPSTIMKLLSRTWRGLHRPVSPHVRLTFPLQISKSLH